MTSVLQIRRGSTAQNNAFTGAIAEITVDTGTWDIRVHDGVTPGGHSISGNAQDLAGGAAGDIPYQSATGVTDFIPIGAADTVLVSDGSTATWVDLATLTGGGGVNADNLLINSITPGDRYLVVTDQTGAYTALEASTLTIYNSSVGLTLKNTATIGGHLLPETNGIYDLGSSSKRWRTLYITSSTIDIAGSTLTADGSTLYFNGQKVMTGTPSGNLTVTNLVVNGDLTVSGTSTFVNSTVTNVSDPIFGIGGGLNGAAPASDDNKDRGIAFQYHTGAAAKIGFFGFDDSTGYFTFIPDATITNEVVSGSQGDLQASNFRGNLIGNVTGNLTGVASTSTNIAGGAAGQLHIQSGAGTTAFVPVGTAGQFLQAGTNTATFVSTSSMYVNSAVNAEKWTTARTITLGGDLSGSMVVDGSQDVTLTATIAANSVALGTDTTGDYVSNGATSGFGLSGSTTGETQTFTVTANSTSANTVSTIVYRDASGNFSAGTITATAFSGPITGTATTATNIAGGAAGQLHIQSGAGTTAFVPVGTSGQFLQAGTNTATFVSTSSMYVNSAVNAEKIFGGTAGQLVYQSGAGTTSFAGPGTAGQLLMSAGTSAPTYTNTSSIYVNNSVNAEKWITARTFTFGGDLSGSMVVDGSQNVTFTATIAANSVALGTDTTGDYVSNGATSGFGLSGSTTGEGQTFTVTANSTSSNTANTIMYRDANGDFAAGGATFSRPVTFSEPVTFSGTATFVYSTNTVYTDNILNVHTPPGGGPTNHVWGTDDGKDIGFIFHYYKSSTDRDAFLGFNNSSQFLEWFSNGSEGGGVYTGTTYGTFRTGSIRLQDTTTVNSTNSGALQVAGGVGINGGLFVGGVVTATTFVGALTGTATTATNVAGGAAGQLHIQSAAGATTFITAGTAGQFLQAGTNTATFVSTSSMYVNSAVNAEKIFGGTAGQLVYQSGVGTTAFAGPGSAGQLLMSAGTSAPTYTNTSSIYVNNSVNAEKWLTARTFTFGGDLSGSMVVDGSQNVTFTATIAANSVALGTDTTGDYVSNGATSGFGLSGSTTGETQTFTVTANSTSANTVSTIVYRDASGNFSAGIITATNASITAVTSATTTQTGALIVTGGLGVGNNIVAGGALFVGTPTGTVGAVGEIRATNEITAYYSSDQNLKENIQLISDPIEKLNQIRGVYFDWKDSFIDYRGGEDGYFVRKHDVGVIAQEVAKVLPEVVAHKSDGYMGVKYEKIIPLLIEAIKDQQRQITQLSEQVNKLVNK